MSDVGVPLCRTHTYICINTDVANFTTWQKEGDGDDDANDGADDDDGPEDATGAAGGTQERKGTGTFKGPSASQAGTVSITSFCALARKAPMNGELDELLSSWCATA